VKKRSGKKQSGKKQSGKNPEAESEWFQKHFPSSRAREAADKAMDALSVTEPMAVFMDRWIAVYIASGGKTNLKFDV
jgi:hypothetical protein